MPRKVALERLRQGVVIPACPLALDEERKLDERHQRALFRYYVAAGAGGIAVGVHTTQFEIRDPAIGLFEPLLEMAAAAIDETARQHEATVVRIAGVCGATRQAVGEAELAASLGYDVGLVSLSALQDASIDGLIEHCRRIGEVIPLMGFYLQPAVGGRILRYEFWREFAEIENAVAIKVAPFNRYYTAYVVRAITHANKEDAITLYTGNDDNIIIDLLASYSVATDAGRKTIRFKGGLLGQWSIWTKRAVEMLDEIHDIVATGKDLPLEMLEKSNALTDANAVVFDAANDFAGCIPGIHEVLRRQGLMRFSHCLDANDGLSPGQSEEIDRVYREYPWLTDDEFVREHLDEWLR
jgi:dihydrodipicolinate synthase/N-acetylneuraminate lyase